MACALILKKCRHLARNWIIELVGNFIALIFCFASLATLYYLISVSHEIFPKWKTVSWYFPNSCCFFLHLLPLYIKLPVDHFVSCIIFWHNNVDMNKKTIHRFATDLVETDRVREIWIEQFYNFPYIFGLYYLYGERKVCYDRK